MRDASTLSFSTLKSALYVYGHSELLQRAETIERCFNDGLLSYDELKEDIQLCLSVALRSLCFDFVVSAREERVLVASAFGKLIRELTCFL